jgi:hypothetical protein
MKEGMNGKLVMPRSSRVRKPSGYADIVRAEES